MSARATEQYGVGDPGRSPQRGTPLAIKRAIDRVGAVVGLIVSAPILAIAALAIRWDSQGPAIYRSERVGRFEQPFTLLKLRSMYADNDDRIHRDHVRNLLEAERSREAGSDATFKLVEDDRITRVGRVIRMTSIDELPQLVNVLRGEMSLVGPRPDVPYAVDAYEPWQRRRFDVLPGLTGLWQVEGRDALSPGEMLTLDVNYVESWSLRQDLWILVRTVPALLEKLRRRTA